MMDCNRMDAVLDDLLEGRLSGPEAEAARAHLSRCETCRAMETSLRMVVRETAGLPQEMLPERDLWPGIEARMRSGRRPPSATGAWGRSVPRLAWAAVFLLALAGLAALLVLRPPNGPKTPRQERPPDFALAALRASEPDYIRARKELRAAIEARKGRLSPETVRVLEDNLALMDGALKSMREALDKDPGNRGLAVLIEGTYRREIELLMQAERLPPNV